MFSNGHECFKHAHCQSGFCLAGRCLSPTKIHDHCSTQLRNCPSGLYCSSLSRTCIPHDYKRKHSCVYESDCLDSEICVSGFCRNLKRVGAPCSTLLPDYCEMGSKCVTSGVKGSQTRCHEQCSSSIPCSKGFTCTKVNYWHLCLPASGSLADSELWQALQVSAIVLGSFILVFGLLYAWIKVTRAQDRKDPRLKRKRVRLQYEGNGLASITVVPSHDQSPEPVAAAHLFNDNSAVTQPPPPYSEAIKMSFR